MCSPASRRVQREREERVPERIVHGDLQLAGQPQQTVVVGQLAVTGSGAHCVVVAAVHVHAGSRDTGRRSWRQWSRGPKTASAAADVVSAGDASDVTRFRTARSRRQTRTRERDRGVRCRTRRGATAAREFRGEKKNFVRFPRFFCDTPAAAAAYVRAPFGSSYHVRHNALSGRYRVR